MSRERVATTITLSSIVQGLLIEAKLHRRKHAANSGFTPGQILSEFCTVGVSTPRQTGKTTWILDQLVDDEEAIAIISTREVQKLVFGAYEQLRGTKLSASVKNRVYSTRDILDAVGERRINRPDELRETFSKVYVDDAAQFFDKVRRSAFFGLLSSRGSDLDIVLIG